MTSSLTGRRIGTFEVGALIGAGGMGEVYRGRDTTLNRDVAIKVLLPAVAGDAERLARFNREAQLLASLNHPNIAHIHGVEQSPDGPLLVLEYVDGPTLADRIETSALPLDESIAIAKQIADALESAHERGIIHRDLKPANIKVDDQGTVKVLDFGLAKAIDQGSGIGDQGSGGLANSPTITSPAMTQAGLIIGTAAYMSPEQAKGRVVDKRSDVWAFGCVLYEMLTGARAFGGEDVTDTIAAVVRGEPDWTTLPASTPAQVRLLLKRCLEKDRKARISDIGVARFLLNETLAVDPVEPRVSSKTPSRLTLAVGGLITGAATVAAAWILTPRETPEQPNPVRFTYAPPATQPLVIQTNDHDLALAPDGSFVIFRTSGGPLVRSRLAIRELNDPEPRPLAGTENARHPFISWDGRWVGYFTGAELRKAPIAGGSSVLICPVSGAPRGASWGSDDFIAFATGDTNALYRVPASGGEPVVMTTPDDGRLLGSPHVLPGGKTVLFSSYTGAQSFNVRLEAIDVDTRQKRTVLEAATDPYFVAPNFLSYVSVEVTPDATTRFRASIRGIKFDPDRLETIGDPVALVDQVMIGTTATANYTLSRRGDLAFVPSNAVNMSARPVRLVWVDRQGRETPVDAPPRSYAMARLSPDGSKVALDVRDQTFDIWIWDLNRRTLSLLNRDVGQDLSPLWTPDGRHVIWTSTRAGGNPNLYRQAADGTGTPERLTVNPSNQFPTSITPDGRIVATFGAGGSMQDIYSIDLSQKERAQVPLVNVQTAFEFGAEISPEGKWIAYHSNESGEFQVYVRPFPNVNSGKTLISTAGGTRAAWARNGRELFYLDKTGAMTAVTVKASDSNFSASAPVKLFDSSYIQGSSVLGLDLRAYDVSPDGRRFLMLKLDEAGPTETSLSTMVIVSNWMTEVKRRLAIP